MDRIERSETGEAIHRMYLLRGGRVGWVNPQTKDHEYTLERPPLNSAHPGRRGLGGGTLLRIAPLRLPRSLESRIRKTNSSVLRALAYVIHRPEKPFWPWPEAITVVQAFSSVEKW